ncbi:hypothetical protein B7486_50005 [cyanobacterium TDX16]|nr:hypothetical protein B7486_50005 [cyanobacterium TDX16]
MNKQNYQIWLASTVFLCCFANPVLSQAQVTSDGTLPTSVTTEDNRNFTITGGSRAGGNLFHSFGEFSVPIGGEAAFDNTLDVQNIISRVTGGSISKIDGLIRANGSTNLFLLNPNGIIFGRDAKLDIGGSFLATTANRLNFADGNFFSATDPQSQPLLTVSVPIGLQFGNTVGSIVNQSLAEDNSGSPVGLQVQPGKTLAMVGGNVFLEGGKLTALGGRIELGSIASPDLVSLTPVVAGWSLGYESVQNFQDIQLSQGALVEMSGESRGDIQLRGRRIAIADGSSVAEYNDGANPGGTLKVKASEALEVSGSDSELATGAFSTGKAADITIETRQLIVSEYSFIDTSSNGDGRGGNLTVNASDSVVVNGSGGLSRLSTQAFGGGDAGELQVKTGRLILRDGGQISSSTRDAGNGGNILIDASESVEVSGQGEDAVGRVVKSGLFSETTRPSRPTPFTGNGGSLKINTGRLFVQDGASISVAAGTGSTGQAGSLDINALKSVEVSGIGSTLLAESASPKPAGNLNISTDNLLVQNGAEVNVSSEGAGDAGNLQVQANSIRLDNGGKLTATSISGEGGNIELSNLNLLLLRGNSEISTDATGGTGNGGNINIDTDLLVGTENSDITANAIKGRGGNIQINTQGIFGIESRSQRTSGSDITATSQQGVNGVVEINRPESDPNADLVTLPAEIIDVSGLVAQGCSAGGSNLARGGSEFVVTGRGGLPPTPAEATRSDTVLADLGTPVQSQENRSSAAIPSNPTPAESAPPLVEANGWVIGDKGEVLLTASAPTVTPDIPWLTPTSCHGS